MSFDDANIRTSLLPPKSKISLGENVSQHSKMNIYRDENDKETNLSLCVDNIQTAADLNVSDESIDRLLSAYKQFFNSNDVDSDCSEEELDVNDSVFDSLVTSVKNRRVESLRRTWNDLKDGNIVLDEMNESVSVGFCDESLKVAEIDFNSFTPDSFMKFYDELESEVERRINNYPSLIANNMKEHLEKVYESINKIMNKIADGTLDVHEQNTRLKSIVALSKVVTEVVNSVELKIKKAKDLTDTLKLYSTLKVDHKRS